MKRILKYLLLIIVVLAAGSPYFAGRIIEKDYNALIDHLNAASQGSAKFVGKYNRGFFSSTATTEVTVQDSYINVQLAHAIKHGPVIFDFQGWTTPKTYMPQRYIFGEIKTKFMGPLEQALENLYGKSPAYDITTVITMHGAFNTDINSYPLNTSLGNGKFNWQGLTANINTTLQLDTIHGTATIPLISYSEQTAKDNESANVTNLKLDFTHAPAAQNSNFDLSIETASIMNGAQNDVSLQKYVINATRKVTNDVVDMELKTTFDKAAVGDQVYGPFDCDVQMKNLDGKALQAMMQGADSAKEYNQHLQELFAKQVTVDGKFTLTTPDGHIAISGHTMLGGPEFNIADAMTKTLTADEDIQVSKKIVYILLAKYAETQ
ncbi:MAG TPA: DUF945 family protein, partial [Gammaproteobacteria bacterium]|nr:DUF945 family protein [Gammaproteobacteria bacterium]